MRPAMPKRTSEHRRILAPARPRRLRRRVPARHRGLDGGRRARMATPRPRPPRTSRRRRRRPPRRIGKSPPPTRSSQATRWARSPRRRASRSRRSRSQSRDRPPGADRGRRRSSCASDLARGLPAIAAAVAAVLASRAGCLSGAGDRPPTPERRGRGDPVSMPATAPRSSRKDPGESRPIASATKLMTALLTLERAAARRRLRRRPATGAAGRVEDRPAARRADERPRPAARRCCSRAPTTPRSRSPWASRARARLSCAT